MEVDEGSNQGLGQTTPSKGQGHPAPIRASKRRRDSEDGEGTPLKLRKTAGSFTPSKKVSTLRKDSGSPGKTPGTPRFTVLKQSNETHDGYRLVCISIIIYFEPRHEKAVFFGF